MDEQPDDDTIIGNSGVAGTLAAATGSGFFGRAVGAGLALLSGPQSALWRACWAGDVSAATAALDAGAAAYAASSTTGWSVLHRACVQGDPGLVALLVARGAPPSLRDSLGRAPIHAAAGAGHAQAVEVLLREGHVFRDSSDGQGRTAAHWAARAGADDVLRVLGDAGAELDLRDALRMTPLHYAAAVASEPAIRELLRRGASLHTTNDSAETPLMVARRRGGAVPAILALLTPPPDPAPASEPASSAAAAAAPQ